MELGLAFPRKCYICYKPGVSFSSSKASGTIPFSAVLSSSASTNTSSSRGRLGTTSRGGQLPPFRFQSSRLWPFVRQNRNVSKNLHMCNRTAAATSVFASAECDATEPAAEGSEGVTEFRLSGNETELSEINRSFLSIRTAKKITFRIRDVGKQFVMNNVAGVVGLLTMFQQQPEPEVLQLRTAMIEKADGATAVQQWSATELTMQHHQLTRIAIDMNYLVFAFAFLGCVRITEAVLAVFSTNPPVFQRMTQSFYAVEYLTIAWLAHNLRKPILNLLQVDPRDLHRVAILKAKVWEELHAFFVRQWKVMATVAVARFFVVVANHIPPSRVTTHVKVLWDMMMALPVF